MKDRILTLVVKVKDQDAAQWIWNSHLFGEAKNGVVVETICEGDEIEKLEEQTQYLHEELTKEDLY